MLAGAIILLLHNGIGKFLDKLSGFGALFYFLLKVVEKIWDISKPLDNMVQISLWDKDPRSTEEPAKGKGKKMKGWY